MYNSNNPLIQSQRKIAVHQRFLPRTGTEDIEGRIKRSTKEVRLKLPKFREIDEK